MRTTILLMALLAAISAAAAGPEDEIINAEKGWATAVLKRDAAALGKIYSDQLIYAHSSGVIESKGDYLDKLRKGTQRYDVIEHQKITVRVHGNAAVAHSMVHMKGQSGARPFDDKLMALHLWVKQDGRWQLAAHQTTKLP